MQRLKIYIDPNLRREFDPEICWTLRVILTGIGYSWEEVNSQNASVDIAYITHLEDSPESRLYILANINNWRERSNLRLQTVRQSRGTNYPMYKGDQDVPSISYVKDGRLIFVRDIIFDTFWLVTGLEEKYYKKDKYGMFILEDTPFFQKQVHRLAIASDLGSALEKNLKNLGYSEPVPRWPSRKKAAFCFTHDVDYPEVKRLLEPIRIIKRFGVQGLPQAISIISGAKTHWHFHSWIKLEKEYGVRSAFYFFAGRGSLVKYALKTHDPFYDVRKRRFRDLFKFLNDEGIEIGLHSSFFAFQSQERFSEERRNLVQSSGQEINGNRHHYWHLNPDDIESTLSLHERIGFHYDMSLGHERYAGWRRGVSWPFFPFNLSERKELKTLQLSTNWMDDQLFTHLRHNPGDRFETLQFLMDKTIEQQGCFVTDIHNYVFDDTLFPGWKHSYFWLIKRAVENSDLWVAPPGEIADHWKNRHTSILKASGGLNSGLGGDS